MALFCLNINVNAKNVTTRHVGTFVYQQNSLPLFAENCNVFVVQKSMKGSARIFSGSLSANKKSLNVELNTIDVNQASRIKIFSFSSINTFVFIDARSITETTNLITDETYSNIFCSLNSTTLERRNGYDYKSNKYSMRNYFSNMYYLSPFT
jgi:hypothetical protein